jgi:hypothetical protein
MSKKPTAPPGLGKSGAALWRRIVAGYELRPDELRLLADACREADLIDSMSELLGTGSLLTAGSMGQQRPNPLLTEIRGHRALLAALLKQLALPDDAVRAAGRPSATTTRAQTAARARWDDGRGRGSA